MKFIDKIRGIRIPTVITIFIASYVLTFFTTIPDRDLWVRLAVGSLFFHTGKVLTHDIFAYTPTKSLWIDHEWGSGAVFYWITSHFGDLGLIILKFILIFLTFYLATKAIKLNLENKKGLEPLSIVLTAFSIFPIVLNTVRAQSFTILFFVLWLYMLERVKRGENRLVWLFPATMLLWANLHGGFVLGLGLVAMYSIGEALNKRNPVKYLVILLSSLAVTLINPYGFNYLKYIAQATMMPRPNIFEWQPINFKGPYINIGFLQLHVFSGYLIFVVLSAITAIKMVFDKIKLDWTKLLVVLAALYMSIMHQRFTIFFVFSSLIFLYPYFIGLFESVSENKSKFIVKNWNIINWALVALFCLFSLPQPIAKTFVSPVIYPVGAVEFIKQNNIKGNLAIPYGWGSYALWKLYPNCLVSVDGRYEEVYSNKVFDEASNFLDNKRDSWKLYLKKMPESPLDKHRFDFLKLYHTDIIVAPKYAFKESDLAKLKGWKAVYEDNLSTVLLPKSKATHTFLSPEYADSEYLWENLAKPVSLN